MQTSARPTRLALTTVIGAATILLAISDCRAQSRECSSIVLGGKKVPYLFNFPLATANPAITRAIIVIHGGYRVPEEYYAPILVALASDPELVRTWRRKTLVLAPHFQDRGEAPSGEHGWKGDWREGGESDGLSSYAVMDALIARLRDGRFPNLKWIVITGHSAGGQFTQRYAAFTDVDLQPGPNAALVKFVPANPSSYVYLNEYRSGGDTDTWLIPKSDCPTGDGYNQWKYGLDRLYGYTAARGAAFARTQLPRRNVEVLAGTADVQTGEGFDSDCAGMWQGATRYERARVFKAHMDHFFPTNHVTLTLVPGVGHSGPAMYASLEGRRALFFPD